MVTGSSAEVGSALEVDSTEGKEEEERVYGEGMKTIHLESVRKAGMEEVWKETAGRSNGDVSGFTQTLSFFQANFH